MAAPPTDSFKSFSHDLTSSTLDDTSLSSTATTNINAATSTTTDLGANLSRAPSPNVGETVPDYIAIGPDSISQQAWITSRGIDTERWIRLKKLSHMRYQHVDLDRVTVFLRDFGMECIRKSKPSSADCPREKWFAGYGEDQYVYYAQSGKENKFLGGAFEVESYHELEKLVERFGSQSSANTESVPSAEKEEGTSGAGKTEAKVTSNGIEEMSSAPGRGYIVTISDPEGFPVNFIYGQDQVERDGSSASTSTPSSEDISSSTVKPGGHGRRHTPGTLLVNSESSKPRQRHFQRFQPGPAAVHKLGHFGLVVQKFDQQVDFYTRNFNIVPSDLLHIDVPPSTSPSSSSREQEPPTEGEAEKGKVQGEGRQERVRKPVALFAHLHHSARLVDHHTIFLSSLAPDSTLPHPHIHHCSFEVHDFDTQALGHQWLARRGYRSVWGVGRHILGSQIFDYWWDTSGFMVEHYADGDLVNHDTPVGLGPAGHEGLAVWGPDVPTEFLH